MPPGLLSGLLFFAVVIAGSGYIVAAKLHGFAAVYVTLVPVAIMLAYALLIGLARLFRLRDDQSGDNLYYMGFLFTLTSLAVSLYQFSESARRSKSSRISGSRLRLRLLALLFASSSIKCAEILWRSNTRRALNSPTRRGG